MCEYHIQLNQGGEMDFFTDEQNAKIRNTVKELIELNGLSMNEFCKEIFVSRRTLGRLLTGEMKWDFEKLDMVARYFGIDPWTIIGIVPVSAQSLDVNKVNRRDFSKAVLYIQHYLNTLPAEKIVDEVLLINRHIIMNSLIEKNQSEE